MQKAMPTPLKEDNGCQTPNLNRRLGGGVANLETLRTIPSMQKAMPTPLKEDNGCQTPNLNRRLRVANPKP